MAMMPPLVFIHGIKGSILRDSKGRLRWLNFLQAIGATTPDLRLPLEWDQEGQQCDDLLPSGILERVAWVQVYGPFLEWARGTGRAFHPFAYDWRRDNLEQTEKFISFLESVCTLHGGAAAQVVAHSMGGLISFVALNRRPELFHSVLFAGVPFGPTISFLEDLHAGSANGYNRKILSPEVLFSFVSPYTFFPSDPAASGLVDSSGQLICHGWYSADDWERNQLGLFARAARHTVTGQQRLHLTRVLTRAAEFRRQICLPPEPTFRYPPLAVVVGRSIPTILRAIRNGPQAIAGWDFQSAPRGEGDGRVPASAATPPQGVPHITVASNQPHDAVLNDVYMVERILADLQAVGRQPVGRPRGEGA